MGNLETFLKSEEEAYKRSISARSNTGLEIDYYSFSLAIKENVQWIEDAYENYIKGDIKTISWNHKLKQNELDIIHWQNMIEIIIEELLKRSK